MFLEDWDQAFRCSLGLFGREGLAFLLHRYLILRQRSDFGDYLTLDVHRGTWRVVEMGRHAASICSEFLVSYLCCACKRKSYTEGTCSLSMHDSNGIVDTSSVTLSLFDLELFCTI